jgi:hypothetical protein
VLDGLAQFVATTFEGGGRMNLALPTPRGVPAGNYLHVETRGRGATQLLLISDYGGGWQQALRLVCPAASAQLHDAHRDAAVRGRSAAPAVAEKLDYAAQPWLSQIERELLALVDQPAMKGVTVVGTAAAATLPRGWRCCGRAVFEPWCSPARWKSLDACRQRP